MIWKELEIIFNRSIIFSFSRKKFLFILPILLFCGLIVVFCRTLAFGAGPWVAMSLAFLPVFLCSAILLAAGIILTRIYHNEVKQIPSSYHKILRQSWELMVGIAYLSVPMAAAYLVLWTVLGIFYLLKAIPAIGNVVGVILSFGPFLLVLGSLLLSFLNVLMLFFITPAAALKSEVRPEIAGEAWKRFRGNVFSSIVLFMVGFLPLLIVTGLLCVAAFVTDAGYLANERSWIVALQWFFIMLPFCAVLAPAIAFFFNFAAESYVWIQHKVKREQE
jgi:hypothetical protein